MSKVLTVVIMHLSMCVSELVTMRVYVCVCMCMHAVCMCVFVQMHVFACVYVCMLYACVCMHMCVFACMCVCVSVYACCLYVCACRCNSTDCSRRCPCRTRSFLWLKRSANSWTHSGRVWMPLGMSVRYQKYTLLPRVCVQLCVHVCRHVHAFVCLYLFGRVYAFVRVLLYL